MTTKNRYHYSSHCVFNLGYHIIWCPKYRRKVLVNGIDERLKELLCQKALQIGVTIEKMEVMHFIVNQLKGYTSRLLRIEYPHLRSRLPTLWSRSYYCESIGHISEKTIERYIADQKNK